MTTGLDNLGERIEISGVIFLKSSDTVWEVPKWPGLTLTLKGKQAFLQLEALSAPPCETFQEVEKALEALVGGVSDGARYLLDRTRTKRNAEQGRKLNS